MIRIRGLTKRYADGQEALRGVDLDIAEGMFGILGPNGAGKTTLLSILVLAVEPTAGALEYHGLDSSNRSHRPAIRAEIGYLPQDFAPIARLSGMEYLVHCAGLRQTGLTSCEIERRARDLLDAVSLTPVAQRRAGGYSGGMQRRLGLAQALIHAPRLLVVDEPTSGLDPEERIRFRNLVTEVAEQTSVLLSTHIVEDIEATCPRLGIIASGRLLFDAAPSELLRLAEGRLWERTAGEAEPPAGTLPVARRIGRDGSASEVLRSDRPVAEAHPVAVNLELAYAAFLALHGQRVGQAPPV